MDDKQLALLEGAYILRTEPDATGTSGTIVASGYATDATFTLPRVIGTNAIYHAQLQSRQIASVEQETNVVTLLLDRQLWLKLAISDDVTATGTELPPIFWSRPIKLLVGQTVAETAASEGWSAPVTIRLSSGWIFWFERTMNVQPKMNGPSELIGQ